MITQDTLATLLLTTKFALPRDAEITPLTLSEWNAFVFKVAGSQIKSPSGLFNQMIEDLESILHIPYDQAQRVVNLLSFASQAALTLDELERKGMWVLSRADDDYPKKIKVRLKSKAPPIFFGAGVKELLNQPGAAMVGSRSVDKKDEEYAGAIASHCSRAGKIIISGGAKGIDTISVNTAIENREFAVAILPAGLSRFIKQAEYRAKLEAGDMVAISAFLPDAGFSVGAAMGRNKYIYALSDFTLVIKSDLEKGGTWAGAKEALKYQWVPIFVRPGFEGNDALIKMGGIAIDDSVLGDKSSFREWISGQVSRWNQAKAVKKESYTQVSLF